jgi:membrane associated rhomboid family serine protease
MSEMQALKRELKAQAFILGGVVALLWVIEVVDAVVGQRLDVLGVIPRTAIGLRGVLFAPFLHASFAHLMANTVPLVVLGWLIMLRDTGDFLRVAAVSAVAAGLGAWLTGAPGSVHLGASGVIFGFLGYLLSRGWYERKPASVLLALLVGAVYGSALFGVLPGQHGISWQSHLFGFVGGVIAARWMTKAPVPALRRSSR